MRNVAIIALQFSVVVKSMEKGLKDKGNYVVCIKDDINELLGVIDGIDVFVLYLPDSVVDDMDRVKNILLICDTLKDRNRGMIVIGAQQNKDSFMKTIPALSQFVWLSRPLDMYAFYKEVEKEGRRIEAANAMKKILIIDDDPMYAQMVREWLKDNYQSDIVTDGMQGISYLVNKQVDLILLDYEMPVVDGPKVLEMLRMHSDTSSIPVIFLTGIGTKESIARVMKLKPQGYILKSTTRENLIETLTAFFEKQQLMSRK